MSGAGLVTSPAGANAIKRTAWPMVPLADVLVYVPRPVSPILDAQYREIGIRSHGRGIFHKPPTTGAEIGSKRVFRVQPGDFVLNIVFAWEGAVAIVSEAENGMIASHRFPTFQANPELLHVNYLPWYFMTPSGRDLLGRVSPGGAGRNRTLNRTAFLQQPIALPSLPEQRRIVAKLDDVFAKVVEARRLADGRTHEADRLAASFAYHLFSAHRPAGTIPLGDISEIQAGVTLGRDLVGRTVDLPYLRVANVQGGYLDLSVVKTVPVLPTEINKWQLQPGDMLLTEGGDWDKLGRGALWRGEIPGCIHQNHIFRVRMDQARFDPSYVLALTNSPYGRDYFEAASKQTTNLASINQRQLKAFPVLNLPLEAQASVLERQRALTDNLSVASRLWSTAEMDALMPAILDRAFRGEL